MKNTVLKLFFLANYFLLILYMSWHVNDEQISTGLGYYISLLITSFLQINITYISSCNIRENKVIWLFCGLLALDSWYILLSFREGSIEKIAFTALSPIIWYVSIKFILMFLFQGSGYKFRKTVNIILLIVCFGPLIGLYISTQIFAFMYGIQFLTSMIVFLFIVVYHWKRVAFVLKSERKCILYSVIVITLLFSVYYFATIELKDHISNFGIYIPTLLFFMSIQGIVLKDHRSVPLSTVFNRKQAILIICSSLIGLLLINLFLGYSYERLLISINMLFAFLYICNIILGQSLKQGKRNFIQESSYKMALKQLQQEEQLKTEFSNFLHDDVLQDLLSVKNMMTKVHRNDVQDIIIETLDSLNTHIRQQMQDYHPIFLKKLNVKENYQNLIEEISNSFHRSTLFISFECDETLFLVEPYNIFIYRILKELITNVFKHSDGNLAKVKLTQINGVIELIVSDNGTADVACLTFLNEAKHKGISSIKEQVNSMEGSIIISNNTPKGIFIKINLPMKGDGSYQYYVS